MNFADKLKGAAQQAKEAVAEHKEQVEQALDKAADLADKQTGGKYHDKIEKAESKADEYVQKLKPENGGGTAGQAGADAAAQPPAGPGAAGQPPAG